ncbi:hypothetical protein MMIC_P0027 [Mariprofundus micogutta]|uniref:Uncharacterized protein n=1 Tax=Mariprofundus micogutta TaxID=1921010 RepID=A0A1L8CJJ9_9PROT|nr:hypothetical protein [Mariprofundus micogutta]GAV19098.1 hypothetical protein MMIC_P0027 [Mariprofundus micogutta]
MIILPVSTPVASIDQSHVNQTQLNHTRSLEDSRIATDTVKISAEAQHLSSSLVNDKAAPSGNDAARAIIADAKKALQEPPKVDVPKNPATQTPESNRIDVLS